MVQEARNRETRGRNRQEGDWPEGLLRFKYGFELDNSRFDLDNFGFDLEKKIIGSERTKVSQVSSYR